MQMSGIQEEEEKENAKKETLKRDTELVKIEQTGIIEELNESEMESFDLTELSNEEEAKARRLLKMETIRKKREVSSSSSSSETSSITEQTMEN